MADTFRLWSALLRCAFDESDGKRFQAWVLRFLDAARAGLEPRGYGFVASALLMIAWEPFTPPRRPFLQTLIGELRAARFVFGWFSDPLSDAANDLAALMGSGENLPARSLLAQGLLQDVSFEDQLRLLGIQPPWK